MVDDGNIVDDGYGVYSRFFNASVPSTMDTGVKSVYPSPLSFPLVGRGDVGPLTAIDSRFNAASCVSIFCRCGRGLRETFGAVISEVDRRWFV